MGCWWYLDGTVKPQNGKMDEAAKILSEYNCEFSSSIEEGTFDLDTMKELKRLGLSQDPHLDRSIGFVAVTPSGMDENMSYAEAVASIYLDTFTVDLMGVWCRIPLSGLEHIDGKWIYGDSKNPEVEIPDVEWNSLKKIRTDDLSMEDVKSFLNSPANNIFYYIDPEWDDLLIEIA